MKRLISTVIAVLAFGSLAVRAAEPVAYLDWDDANRKMTNATLSATDYELVTTATREFADGKWYVVADTVVIDNGANIKVNGSARLILCDDASLTITNVADNMAAIDVSAGGSVTNALTIYGQQNGSGLLTATGGWRGAGIGTAERSETAEGCGAIVINGGVVTATGGDGAAGIGGGYNGAGGTVTINSGTVTATGGYDGAGIGGGDSGAGGTVTINGISPERSESPTGDGYQGCAVTATGGYDGAGIGGGYNGAGGTVSVNGGTVKATGGDSGAGIGGGMTGAGGVVTINGGIVTATGGQFGAGIGGGDFGDGHGKVTFGAGAWLVLAGDSAPGSEVSAEDYANDHRAAYAHIAPLSTLKIPAGVHYSYVVSNETAGAELKGVLADGTNTYMVLKGATVKVYFTPDEDYGWDGEFDNPKNLGVIECDKVVDASEMPKVKGLPGSEVNPWSVGENVTAYIKDRVLYLKGTGAMYDFASAAEVPWAAVADQVTAVTVEDGVTKVGKNALAGMKELETINGENVQSTYRTVTTVNGKPIGQFNMMADALGNAKLVYPPETPPVPDPPAGAVTTWDALTNAVATAESGAVIAVGADISEPDGVLTIAKGQAVTILLCGKVVSCQKVVVEGALTVGAEDDSVGKIVAAEGAQIGRVGSVVLLGGPMRGTFTSTTPGLAVMFR